MSSQILWSCSFVNCIPLKGEFYGMWIYFKNGQKASEKKKKDLCFFSKYYEYSGDKMQVILCLGLSLSSISCFLFQYSLKATFQ